MVVFNVNFKVILSYTSFFVGTFDFCIPLSVNLIKAGDSQSQHKAKPVGFFFFFSFFFFFFFAHFSTEILYWYEAVQAEHPETTLVRFLGSKEINAVLQTASEKSNVEMQLDICEPILVQDWYDDRYYYYYWTLYFDINLFGLDLDSRSWECKKGKKFCACYLLKSVVDLDEI